MPSSRDLKTLLDNTSFRLEQGVGRCSRGEFSGELYFGICLNWRVFGMCKMLLEADDAGFAQERRFRGGGHALLEHERCQRAV